ncbi:uncharacterized protein MELLADRAFT_108046 [Melampsora larici-populina 98AG31]|uniref:Uncharacterized protein n=1 Tax=Melampsora larici-populina (strain 98AG31 / pathotype 3-4-7) TaxID=747676 RepID=F4RRS7_MELLP|nr:uncharacterized protein MELLADRAFT_108046 [Melampsora larici-populina 98AG31]EGG04734.1 hypothetical protein MELLADRAFT_108046 [Melampsora larici-populina 98AG31]
MPIGRPATPFPDMDSDRDDDEPQSQPSHPRPPSNVRNYLDNSGVLITGRIRRPNQTSMIPIPSPTDSSSRRPSKDIKPLTHHHHHKPEALVADLSSSNGKNLKRLSLILKGDPNEILKPSKKSIHPNTSVNSHRNNLDHPSTSSSTPGLSSSSSLTPTSGSSSTSNGLGKLQQEQLLHLSKLKEKQKEKKKDEDSNRKRAQELKTKICEDTFKDNRLYTLDRIKTFGIGYG